MRKRMIDQDIFDNPWFESLSMKHKLLWKWIFLHCDMAGVIKPSWKLASMQIGAEVTEDDLTVMKNNIVKLSDGKFLIPGFIPFQYGSLANITENSKSAVWRGVYRCLRDHGLTYPFNLTNSLAIPPRRVTLTKGYGKG